MSVAIVGRVQTVGHKEQRAQCAEGADEDDKLLVLEGDAPGVRVRDYETAEAAAFWLLWRIICSAISALASTIARRACSPSAADFAMAD